MSDEIPYTFAQYGGFILPAAQLDANFSYLLGLIDTQTPVNQFVASEVIVGPGLVNITTSFEIQAASGALGYQANGYITQGANLGDLVNVYFTGVISGFSGLVYGPVFLSTSVPGQLTQTPPAIGSGDYVQQVGTAISSSAIVFISGPMNGPL